MSPQSKHFSAASRWNLVLVAGILFALACPPYDQAWAAWLVPGLLLVVTRKLSPLRAAVAGIVYAVAIGVTVGNWIPDATAGALGISTLSARSLVYAFFVVNPGIPCALMLAAYSFACRRVSSVDRPIVGAFLWVASEWLRSAALGWELLGHTQYRATWLIQVADLGGAYLVSFLVAFVSLSVAELIAERAWRKVSVPALAGRLVLPATALLVAFVYGVGAASVYGPYAAVSDERLSDDGDDLVPEFRAAAYRGGEAAVAYVRPALHLREVSMVSPAGLGEMAISPILCLDLLDGGLMRDLVRDGAEVLINNCRVAWMDGKAYAAQAQHLSMAVLRAVETRRFVLRAASDEEARMITPFGLSYEQPPSGKRVALRAGMTRYITFGDLWILFGMGISVATMARGRGRIAAAATPPVDAA